MNLRERMIAEIGKIQTELKTLGVRDIEFFNFREMSDDQIIEEGKALRAQLERKKGYPALMVENHK